MDLRIADYSCRMEAFEDAENAGVNTSNNPTLGDIVAQRVNRRDLLRGMTATAVAAALVPSELMFKDAAKAAASSFGFKEIEHGVDEKHHVAEGYDADVLIRWGDPITAGAPAFDPMNQTAEAQLQQFGYNNDFIGYVPLPAGSGNSEHGLLAVNHEYTSPEVMFPKIGEQGEDFAGMTKEFVDVEMAAHGMSIVEVRKEGGKWSYVQDSPFNRRISALRTEMQISGPAAGDDRLKTKADPTGTRVIGMLNNCAGGYTPWGTILSAEENFNGYFWGKDALEGHPEERNYKRVGLPGQWYAWGKYHDRFDISKEPNEANRHGYIVEIDPYDPTSTPVKRTALGRFKHEGCMPIVNTDGRVVLYSGDDQRFDYLYKFVTHRAWDPNNRANNRNLLDEGTLFVAKMDAEGGVEWMPLVWGAGPLTEANGFNSQADVIIETRRAADLLGATKLDRPEDVEPNPKTGKVYVMLTNNSKRKEDQVDAVNARANNIWGQILEITYADGDHFGTKAKWELLVQCGNPADPATGSTFNPATSKNGWFACPDNCAVDPEGRLWVTTDQGGGWSKASGTADGVWAMETEGERRGTGRMFFRVPVGAEMCGPKFTDDSKTLFVAVQHPATDGTKDYKPFGRASTFEDPATRWPDFKDGVPPRPSVVAITKKDGGRIGDA